MLAVEAPALLVRGRGLLAVFPGLVALRVKTLARQQFLVETTNVPPSSRPWADGIRLAISLVPSCHPPHKLIDLRTEPWRSSGLSLERAEGDPHEERAYGGDVTR
jgi:hypothetical protein